MTAALFGWFVMAVAAVYALGLVRAAHRAVDRGAGRGAGGGAEGTPTAGRADLVRRAVATATGLVAARALAPGDVLATAAWGLLVAAFAWGLLTGATAWRGLPWAGRRSERGPRRTRVELAAETGLLVLAVAAFVP